MSQDRWLPDRNTLEWVLAVIDEETIGRDVRAQLGAAGVVQADDAKLGEAAVEVVILRALAQIDELATGHGPIHGSKVPGPPADPGA